MATSAIYGEKFPSKVAAEFDSADDARQAADLLGRQAGISAKQVRLVGPDDSQIDHALEPETRGIGRTLARSHLTLGISGLIVGLLIALVLVITGYSVFRSSPYYTFGILAGFGAVGGLLLAGLISLRPDHDHLLARVKDAARNGRWFLLVHTRDHDEERTARDVLKQVSGKTMSTF
jgi:hypothetical protein